MIIIYFLAILIGFILGFLTAALCAVAGRASEMTERILNHEEVTHGD